MTAARAAASVWLTPQCVWVVMLADRCGVPEPRREIGAVAARLQVDGRVADRREQLGPERRAPAVPDAQFQHRGRAQPNAVKSRSSSSTWPGSCRRRSRRQQLRPHGRAGARTFGRQARTSARSTDGIEPHVTSILGLRHARMQGVRAYARRSLGTPTIPSFSHGNYSGTTAYARTKRMQIVLTPALERARSRRRSRSDCPGWANTDMGSRRRPPDRLRRWPARPTPTFHPRHMPSVTPRQGRSQQVQRTMRR